MIYLLRHCETEQSDIRRYVGQLDIPLGKNGVRQAEFWQREFASITFDRVFCSDLKRSVDTARIISGESFTIVPQLREIGLGQWEGMSRDDVREQRFEEYKSRGENLDTYRPPDGESFADLQKRVLPAFQDIAVQEASHILVVGHAGTNRIILCHVLGMPLRNLFRLAQDYGALNMIDNKSQPWRVITLNQRIPY